MTNNLIKDAENLAYKYEQTYKGCSQVVLGAIREAFENHNVHTKKITDSVFKAGTGLAGGIGLKGQSCGALTGGVMVLSSFLGREYDNFEDPEKVRFDSFRIAKKLVNKFEEEYGSSKCYDIHEELMGKHFNLWDDDEYEAFDEAGGHDDKCPSVCKNAVRWTLEILEEENLLW